MTRWLEPEDIEIPAELLPIVENNPLVAAVLVRRGIATAAAARSFLDPACYRPAPAADLPGLSAAVVRLEEAIRRQELIGVWGDFDADGVTSTALLLGSLREVGAQALFYIPDRATESHGIHIPSLQRLISRGIRVLLTCDTGSTDLAAVAYARGQGVDVIITDHHDLGPEMPSALAFVNPKLLPNSHPLRDLSGVGVAYKLIEEMFGRRGQADSADQQLDLVAIGQVADVSALRQDVRYLVQRGLVVIRGAGRMGLRALMEVAGIEPGGVTEHQIGFALAPRLNALGRLTEATAAVELFTTHDVVRARTIATEMEALNLERQLLSSQVLDAAVSIIERDSALLRSPVIVVDRPGWPAGVLGIVAGQLAQRYQRPAIVISTSEDGVGRGSARSVAGIDIREAIAAQKRLLHRFGGHPMAAGLSIAVADIPAFREAIVRTVAGLIGDQPPEPSLEIAAYMPLSALTLSLASQIERLAPFGVGNPPVYLATRNVRIVQQAIIGQAEKHRRLTIQDQDGQSAVVLWWNGANQELPEGPFDLAYTVRTRDYLGYPEIQLHWEDARLSGREAIDIARGVGQKALSTGRDALSLEITDCRGAVRPEARLKDLLAGLAGEAGEIWAEGLETLPEGAHRRDRLSPAHTLVIWTAPAGPQELRQALAAVMPGHVVVFDQIASLDAPQPFLARLISLVKYDLNVRGGRCRIADLAAAMGHREQTVRKGVEWLVARGQIVVINEEDGVLLLDRANRPVEGRAEDLYRQLRVLLDETGAYRSFFRRADLRALFTQTWPT